MSLCCTPASSDSMSNNTALLDAAVAALGGATREGQVAMSEAVARSMQSGRHLAVQAGTGTGKSLAYLVPAFAHAQATGTTVVVSTATIALQRQLVERDLPRLAEALEPHLERKPTFAIMKGRSNYLCMHKVSQGVAEPEMDFGGDAGPGGGSEVSWLGRHVQRLYDWANETETGDRDQLEPGVPNLAWRQVSVSARECVGASRCPHGDECFAEIARKQAKDVDVVVTNHAMLAIDALSDINVLPEHDVVIIDEAHELDGRITAVATTEISPTALTLSARRAGKLGANDETLVAVAKELFFPQGRITELDQELQAQLVLVRDELWKLKEHIARTPEGEALNDPERYAERIALSNHLSDQHDAVVRVLEVSETEDSQDVIWATETTLFVAPLSVAGLLNAKLFSENTVILTSATLSIGGNFEAIAASWGIPKGTWDSLDAGTPFTPQKSGILYTPRRLPAPGRDGLADATRTEMHELIMAAGGRTLGLFSSKRAAEEAAEALRPLVPFDIFLQGEDSTGVLVERFAKAENACLFGTLTLWQGVDVPGPSLSLVLIDRIPFPRPDDPLLQARKEAADAAGRNGFMEVAATHAALLLAQGAGRLLRSVDDRGVVAILDSRIVTARYGSFFLRSIPPFWRTEDGTVVKNALKRLVSQR